MEIGTTARSRESNSPFLPLTEEGGVRALLISKHAPVRFSVPCQPFKPPAANGKLMLPLG